MNAVIIGLAVAGAVVIAIVAYLLGRRLAAPAATAVFDPDQDAPDDLRAAAQAAWMRRLLLSADSEELFYANVAAGIVDLVPADAGSAILLDATGERARCVAAAGLGADEMRGISTTVHPDGPLADARSAGRAILIADLSRVGGGAPALLRVRGMTSAVIAPLSHEGRCVGFICALRTAPTVGPETRAALTELSRLTEVGLDNASLLAQAEQSKERAEVTLHSIGDAVITTGAEGLVEYLNPVAEMMTGCTNIEAHGLPIAEVFDVIDETTGEPLENPVTRCLRTGATCGIPPQSALVRRDGRIFAIDDSAAPIRDEGGQIIGAVLVFHDVSRSRALARQLAWQAQHDALTGLPNRRHFEDSLRLAIETAREQRTTHVMLFLDLDQFKLVNDTCGHRAGDELLKQLTAMLQPRMRSIDTLARLGGDEFGVLLVGTGLTQGTAMAEELRETIRTFRFVWGQTAFELGVSIGVVEVDHEAGTINDVMSSADMALYAAKEHGRNRVHVYEPGDQALAERRGQMRWVWRITKALEDNRLVLYSQAIVPVGAHAAHAPHHVEVLVRMRARDGKLVPPSAFIPAAERFNMMLEIDRWVVSHVLAAMRRSLDETGDVPMCAINLSGASLSDEALFPFIGAQLRDSGVPPAKVCFEITETAAIQNLPRASALIGELKRAGCRFALDDFGSGLSSFAYMKALPVDFIKIDGSFVREMARDPVSHAIVVASHSVARALGVSTIAEFVENQTILDSIVEIGVDYAQGYGIMPPQLLSEALATARSQVG